MSADEAEPPEVSEAGADDLAIGSVEIADGSIDWGHFSAGNLTEVSEFAARAAVDELNLPTIQWLEPARVAVSLGSGSYQESVYEGSIGGVTLRDGDRVLIDSPAAEAGVYEFQVSQNRGALYPLDIGNNNGGPIAMFIREGEHEGVGFLHDPSLEHAQWLPLFAKGFFALTPSCLTDQAALDDIQTAAENWTPESVARFLAVLHHRKHDGEEFSVELDEAMKNDTWTENEH